MYIRDGIKWLKMKRVNQCIKGTKACHRRRNFWASQIFFTILSGIS